MSHSLSNDSGPETTRVLNTQDAGATAMPPAVRAFTAEEIAELRSISVDQGFDPMQGWLQLDAANIPRLNTYLRKGARPPSSIFVRIEAPLPEAIDGFEMIHGESLRLIYQYTRAVGDPSHTHTTSHA